MKHARVTDYVHKVQRKLHLHKLPPGVRKILIGIAGGVVLVLGCAMMVLPGPAFIVIPVGLIILASEFKWARRWTDKAGEWMHRATDRIRQRRRKTAQTVKS